MVRAETRVVLVVWVRVLVKRVTCTMVHGVASPFLYPRSAYSCTSMRVVRRYEVFRAQR